MKMLVKIGDNENKNYNKEVEIEVSAETFLVLKYGLKEEIDIDIYDNYYNKLINNIKNQVDNLPEYWYIDEFDF